MFTFKFVQNSTGKNSTFQFTLEFDNILKAVEECCVRFKKIYDLQENISLNGGKSNAFSVYKTKIFTLSIYLDKELITDLKFKITDLNNDISLNLKILIENEIEIANSRTTKLPDIFSAKNIFSKNLKSIINVPDIFSNRNAQLKVINEKSVETIFSDFEAFAICSGIENNRSRLIARSFFEKNTIENAVEAHIIAMNTFKKYGAHFLSYLIKLPPLPFKAIDANKLFSELDKKRNNNQSPMIRFLFKNEKGENEKLGISFFVDVEKLGSKLNRNVFTVKNLTTGKQIMKISRSGFVVPEDSAHQIIPVLQLFIRVSENPFEAILNYGLETGECAKCGRKLTDSHSVKKGFGPVCGEYI